MARKKRKTPGINGTSSADIAFMLLLFFLLTSSMDTDHGIRRQLPRPPEKDKKENVDINKRNILLVMVNQANQILCGGEEVALPQLKEKAKEFIENPNDLSTLPEKEEVEIPFFGKQMVTKHVISLQCDRGTKYQTYIDVQNALAGAYHELRDAVSLKQFNKKFSELEDDQMEAVQKLYPLKISEAEPQTYGDKLKNK